MLFNPWVDTEAASPEFNSWAANPVFSAGTHFQVLQLARKADEQGARVAEFAARRPSCGSMHDANTGKPSFFFLYLLKSSIF